MSIIEKMAKIVNDGDVAAGDAYHITPGHDAWVEGDEPVTAYEFGGMWEE